VQFERRPDEAHAHPVGDWRQFPFRRQEGLDALLREHEILRAEHDADDPRLVRRGRQAGRQADRAGRCAVGKQRQRIALPERASKSIFSLAFTKRDLVPEIIAAIELSRIS